MRLIDADALLADCVFSSPQFEKGMREFIADAPTIDAVPVVRCKDCKYSRTEKLTVKSQVGLLETRSIRFCDKNEMPIAVRADMHFCSWGERKDNGT